MTALLTRYVPKYARFLALVYLVCILIFGLFRLLLLLTNIPQINAIPGGEKTTLLLQAFLMGLRYDTVILSYIFIIPFVLLSLVSLLNKPDRFAYRFSYFYLVILLSLSFLICSIDIPFFNQFGERLSSAVFTWSNNPAFMFGMIFREPRFYGYLFPFLIAAILFIVLLKKIQSRFLDEQSTPKPLPGKLIWFVFFSLFLVGGIRGRLNAKSPINEGTAFFCNYPLPNYLGLNPVFTLAKSIRHELNPDNRKLHLMDDQAALDNVQNWLKIPGNSATDLPLARAVQSEKAPLKSNVVIVIMEGMSTFLMGDYGGPKGLTPVLDSLQKNSYSFTNIYTAGIHTHNGIYSTLFSFPALMKKHPMYTHFDFAHTGIASVLKDNNYATLFFTTHDAQFDNTGGFLLRNGFDRVISEKDYPKKEVISTLGVPDHFMFGYSINELSKATAPDKNFLAVYMTASNHGPYILPSGIDFKPKSLDTKEQLTEYSDWAIGQFLKQASLQEWYSNTLFVFIADHGLNMGHTYDMPLSFHHSPMIIHAPGTDSSAIFDCIGGQIDLAPTLLGMLNISYTNNTMGIDLLREKRPFIFFSADEKIGCLDKTHFYIYRKNGMETLYEYGKLSTQNYLEQLKPKADSMKNYAFSMMQAAEWIIENNKAGKNTNSIHAK